MNVHDKEWTPPWGGYSQQRHVPLPAPIHPPQQLQQHRSPTTMVPVSPAPQPPSDNYMSYYYPSSPHYYGHPSDPRTTTVASPLRRSDSSPIQRPFHSGSNMSSQPTTPKPSSSAPSSPPTLPPPPQSQQQHQQQQQPSPPSDQSSTPDNNNRTPSAKRVRQSSAVYSVNEPSPKFGATKYNGNLFAVDRTTVLDVRIQSKFDRGFFIADNDWTCYRRNYFQVNGTFSIQGFPMYYQNHDDPGYGCLVRADDNQLHPVRGFMMGITARVSDEDKPINLIQHTPKRDKGPQSSPEPKPVRPGGDLNVMSVTDQSVVTFERIQFKTATANNGKRRAAQQYYVLLVELMARLDSGHLVKIASNRSAPLVVRGRSPGHYAERRGGREDDEALPSPSQDQPLSASASASASSQPPQLPPPASTAGVHTAPAPALTSNDYYYNHAPTSSSTTQQRAPSYQNGHHPHMPMMATPPPAQSPLDGPVVMRGPHDRSISAPGSVDIYPHDMNRYSNGGGYYQHHHHNPRDSSPWGSVHTRMASSGESYQMPSNNWYYQYNDSRHHHASAAAAAATNDHHGMTGSPGAMHPYQQSLPTPSTANSPYRTLPSNSFPSIDYHSDSASTSYVRDETKTIDGTIKSNHRSHHGDEVRVKQREMMEQHGRE